LACKQLRPPRLAGGLGLQCVEDCAAVGAQVALVELSREERSPLSLLTGGASAGGAGLLVLLQARPTLIITL